MLILHTYYVLMYLFVILQMMRGQQSPVCDNEQQLVVSLNFKQYIVRPALTLVCMQAVMFLYIYDDFIKQNFIFVTNNIQLYYYISFLSQYFIHLYNWIYQYLFLKILNQPVSTKQYCSTKISLNKTLKCSYIVNVNIQSDCS